MMRAEIKAIWSPDIEDLASYQPEDPANFGFLLRLLIGPVGQEDAELFQLTVCTPEWLQNSRKDPPAEIIIGGRYLLVLEYNYERIARSMSYRVEHSWGGDWYEMAKVASRIGYWEFEDQRRNDSV